MYFGYKTTSMVSLVQVAVLLFAVNNLWFRSWYNQYFNVTLRLRRRLLQPSTASGVRQKPSTFADAPFSYTSFSTALFCDNRR